MEAWYSSKMVILPPRFIPPFAALCVICTGLTAWSSEVEIVIPCPHDTLSHLNERMTDLRAALDESVDLLEDQDFRAQAKAADWLGARNAEDTEIIADVLAAASSFTSVTQFLCHPLSQSSEDGFSTVAYVYSEAPIIHLYGDFFEYPETGFESQVGILLHEMTHLHFVESTNSFEKEIYSAADVLNLAATDPEAAMRNAQGYEFFVTDLIYGEGS